MIKNHRFSFQPINPFRTFAAKVPRCAWVIELVEVSRVSRQLNTTEQLQT